MSKKMKIILTLTLSLFIVGCSQKATSPFSSLSKTPMKPSSFENLPHWQEDNHDLALDTFIKSCHLKKSPLEIKSLCQKAKESHNAQAFFEEAFVPYQLHNDEDEQVGLITGYYEPQLNGSLSKHGEYKYPIYAVPNDMITVNLSTLYPSLKPYRLRGQLKDNKLLPYFTREEIEKRILDAEVLCYCDDPIKLFFLHIQGSGKVKLEDGTLLNIGYANQNGHPYFAIGKALIKQGYILRENISLQSIDAFLRENPDKMQELLNLNPSYVFFEKREVGASGSVGVELTPKRSVAVDPNSIHLGLPLYLSTTDPLDSSDITQLMVAQDTGGAIKGQIRVDYFWGNGILAELRAGKMAQQGQVWIFIPKELHEQTVTMER
jgi:membrane-bound lytic murein transglycosylase A